MNPDNRYPISVHRPTPKPTALTVPVGVWKQGMCCIELPELAADDPDAPVPCVWSSTEAGARKLAEKAIKQHAAIAITRSSRELGKASWVQAQANAEQKRLAEGWSA